MITLNTRGKWRAMLSAMLSACLMAGTVWVFTLQCSAIAKDESTGERKRVELRELVRGEGQATLGPAPAERQINAQLVSAVAAEASSLASELARAKLYDPSVSREQQLSRANSAEARFEALQDKVNGLSQILDQLPEAARLLNSALDDLKGACHFYKSYYYAENSDGEASTERLMKQKTRSAGESLAKAEKNIKENGQ
jgi:hypothetical protein